MIKIVETLSKTCLTYQDDIKKRLVVTGLIVKSAIFSYCCNEQAKKACEIKTLRILLFQNHSKMSQMIIVLVGLSSFPTAVHSDPLAIIDSLIDFKEDLFAGKVGDKGTFLV